MTNAALFTQVRDNAAGVRHEPEIYPRPHSEVYVCGEPDAVPLPDKPEDVTPVGETCDRVIANCAVVASCLKCAVSLSLSLSLARSLTNVPILPSASSVLLPTLWWSSQEIDTSLCPV